MKISWRAWLSVLNSAHHEMLNAYQARKDNWAILVADDLFARRYQLAHFRYNRAMWSLKGPGLIKSQSLGKDGWVDNTKEMQLKEFQHMTQARATAREALEYLRRNRDKPELVKAFSQLAAENKEDDLKPVGCHHCDFGSGQRGMDSCPKCDGTGSLYWVVTPSGWCKFYPNTEEGYKAALKARRGL